MTKQEYLLQFLNRLESRIPPAPSKHHAITFARYGNETDGWEDKLQLVVNNKGRLISLFLYSTDLEKKIPELVQEIERLISEVSAEIVKAGE
jgi:hypothetical protein